MFKSCTDPLRSLRPAGVLLTYPICATGCRPAKGVVLSEPQRQTEQNKCDRGFLHVSGVALEEQPLSSASVPAPCSTVPGEKALTGGAFTITTKPRSPLPSAAPEPPPTGTHTAVRAESAPLLVGSGMAACHPKCTPGLFQYQWRF
ncbi:hypothetical protein PBY51_004714 [Eleginops maclovinus]|uniref:Uncharacterized protein n=1 Tax=Eleginops maclovinus TaxID=56733 RepID=A0AAN8AGP3_ELEMC|nr:hypothetical protein PBY51_004714 [Eleginops maclovinus]